MAEPGCSAVAEVVAGVAAEEPSVGMGSLGPLGIAGASPVRTADASAPLGCLMGASTAGTDMLGAAAESGLAEAVAAGAEADLEAEPASGADDFFGEGLSPGAMMSRTRAPDDALEDGAAYIKLMYH